MVEVVNMYSGIPEYVHWRRVMYVTTAKGTENMRGLLTVICTLSMQVAAATSDAARKVEEATDGATRTEATVTDEATRRVFAAEEASLLLFYWRGGVNKKSAIEDWGRRRLATCKGHSIVVVAALTLLCVY